MKGAPAFRLRKLSAFLCPVATDTSPPSKEVSRQRRAYGGAAEVTVSASATSAHPHRPLVRLENEMATLEVDLAGGSLTAFSLKTQGVPEPTNPLSWRAQMTNDGSPAPAGHFMCCDRWGAPSKAELANGMPFHGEASSQLWHSQGGSSALRAGMNVELPMAGMSVERQIAVAENAAAVHVAETVTNNNLLGRMYNVVQHPSIAPPFLDEATVVDSNATRGFPQSVRWLHLSVAQRLESSQTTAAV